MQLRRDVFHAIADPTRRAIIGLLSVHAMTPGALAAHFQASRQTISKHIQILSECALVRSEAQGREIYYNLNPQKLKDIADFLEPFRQLWEERFNKLESVMKRHATKR